MAYRHPDVSKRKASKSSISKGMKFNTKGKKRQQFHSKSVLITQLFGKELQDAGCRCGAMVEYLPRSKTLSSTPNKKNNNQNCKTEARLGMTA